MAFKRDEPGPDMADMFARFQAQHPRMDVAADLLRMHTEPHMRGHGFGKLWVAHRIAEILMRRDGKPFKRRKPDGGEPVPVKPRPTPNPLAGAAAAPLDEIGRRAALANFSR